MPADLAVIGLGHLGLPLAQAAVAAGIATIGYDPDAVRTTRRRLTPAELPPNALGGLPADRRPGRTRPGPHRRHLRARPPSARTAPSTSPRSATAARTLAARLRPHTTVILESAVSPGTTEDFLRPLLETGSGLRAGRDFHLAYSPSRLDPGNRDARPRQAPPR